MTIPQPAPTRDGTALAVQYLHAVRADGLAAAERVEDAALAARADGLTLQAIADAYGVHRSTVLEMTRRAARRRDEAAVTP